MKRFNNTDATTLTGTQFVHEWVHYLTDNGHSIIDASRGRPSLPVDDSVLHAMRDVLDGAHAGTFPYGKDALGEAHYRAAVADAFTAHYRTPFSADNILFTPGGQFCLHAAFLLAHQRCPDGVFISTAPGYLNYGELIRYAAPHAELIPAPLSKESGYRFTPETLEATLNSTQKPISAFVFCNPLNPTGQVISVEEWREFSAILHRYDAPIILDEAFVEVVFGDPRDCSLLHADPTLKERIILLRSGTKAHAMPGERLSVAAVPTNMVEAFRYHQSRVLGNPPILAQAGMAAAITSLTPARLAEIAHYYAENATILMQQLDDTLGPHAYIAPQGGFFLLANFSHLLGQPMPAAARNIMHITTNTIRTDIDIMAALLLGGADGKTGLALVPGSYFGTNPTDGIMRISYSIPREEIHRIGPQCG